MVFLKVRNVAAGWRVHHFVAVLIGVKVRIYHSMQVDPSHSKLCKAMQISPFRRSLACTTPGLQLATWLRS